MSNEVRDAVTALLGSVEVYQADGSWSEKDERALFDRLVEQRWTRVGLPERLGGDGGELSDALAVVAAGTASGHRLPLADILVGTARLLTVSTMELPADASCVLPVLDTSRVPWARWASHFLLLGQDGRLDLIDAADVELTPGQNMAGEPREAMSVSSPAPVRSARVSGVDLAAELRLAGAFARSAQLAEGVASLVELTARYCGQREQFGRPLAKFQAVQHHLAAMAAEAAAARAAVAHALAAVDLEADTWPVAPIATAKVRTGVAAGTAAKLAHQLHGAIGFTEEHPLHRYTRALWSWRDEYGNEHTWARTLTTELTSTDDLWTALTS